MANEKILEQKKGVVSEISDKISKSASTIFFDYRGLTDEQISLIRKELKKSNSEMKIYKNTMTKRALDDLKFNMDYCTFGPSAVVFGEDSITPIKIIADFSKKYELLKVKGGIVDGKETSMEVLTKLSAIPSRDALITMLASGMLGVINNLSISLKLYAEKLKEEGN
ncbi:MAG: 50S ribosomal protein L10 [Tenericutes bacterium]|jgi:large subunit ribosomal protein L10|nr:50S ribosomal protein L10 [Mycoplasmatota bacterium]